MNEYIPYIVFGLTSGAVYGISAMGLVLTYKTSGIFNFGHGAVSAAAAYGFYAFRQQHGLAWPLAALLTVLLFGVVVGLVFERVSVALAQVHTSFKIVGTVGILVAVQSLANLCFGTQALSLDPFLPQDPVFHIQDVAVSWDAIISVLLGVGSAIGLYLFFKSTRLGTAMRGVVDDPQLLDMMGTPPARVRRSAWIIGSTFAAVSGVLFASAQHTVDILVLSLLVVQAFGAAAIARFNSLPMCLVGGLIVGLLQKLVSMQVGKHPALQGLDLNVPFLVLFLVLLVAKRGKLVEVGRAVKARAVPPSPFSPRVRMGGYLALAAGALVLPALVGTHQPLWNNAMTWVTLFASLALLVRTSGQISLCHIGFAAIGAAGFGHMLGHGVPWLIALLLGGLFAVPAGLLIAIPAMRLSGLYLGLATLGFGILLAQYAYNKSWMFGFGHLETGRPQALGLDNDKRFYYVLLAIAAAAIGIVALVERSRMGRLLRGLADSPIGLSTLGTNINVTRLLVFCVSTFLAGISGAAYSSQFPAVSPDSFSYVQSLVVLAVMAIAGRRTVTIAVMAPVLLYVVPGYIDDEKLSYVLQIGFGVAAVIAAAVSQGALAKFFDRNAAESSARKVDPVFDPTRAGAYQAAVRRPRAGGRAARRRSPMAESVAQS